MNREWKDEKEAVECIFVGVPGRPGQPYSFRIVYKLIGDNDMLCAGCGMCGRYIEGQYIRGAMLA
jgi:hypothetical protein